MQTTIPLFKPRDIGIEIEQCSNILNYHHTNVKIVQLYQGLKSSLNLYMIIHNTKPYIRT